MKWMHGFESLASVNCVTKKSANAWLRIVLESFSFPLKRMECCFEKFQTSRRDDFTRIEDQEEFEKSNIRLLTGV